MRRISQNRTTRVATRCLLPLVLAAGGCDLLQDPEVAADQRAADAVRRGDYQAAAQEKNASPAVAALAQQLAARENYADAVVICRQLDENELAIAKALWDIGRMADQAQFLAHSSTALSGYNPQKAITNIDRMIKQVQGGQSAQWSAPAASSTVPLPTIAATEQNAKQLKDRLDEMQRQLQSLQQQRISLLQRAQQLKEQSNTASGRQSVELYKQAADTTRQAEDVNIRIEEVQAALIPLQQDLAVAEEMLRVSSKTLEVMTGHRESIEKGWRGVQAQADERLKAAGALFSADATHQASVLSRSRQLNQLLADRQSAGENYEQAIQSSLQHAQAAVSSAESAARPLTSGARGERGVTPRKLALLTLDPAGARFSQGRTAFSLGDYQLAQTQLTAMRARVAEKLQQTAQTLNQKLPEGFDPAALTTELQQRITQTAESLKSADEQFATVIESPLASDHLRDIAQIGRMVTLHASAVTARIANDPAAAEHLTSAKAIRDALAEKGVAMPALAAELQQGMPAPKPAAE